MDGVGWEEVYPSPLEVDGPASASAVDMLTRVGVEQRSWRAKKKKPALHSLLTEVNGLPRSTPICHIGHISEKTRSQAPSRPLPNFPSFLALQSSSRASGLLMPLPSLKMQAQLRIARTRAIRAASLPQRRVSVSFSLFLGQITHVPPSSLQLPLPPPAFPLSPRLLLRAQHPSAQS